MFNLFNSPAALDVGESYTDDEHPIVGGDASALGHLDAIDREESKRDTARVARARPNYGNTTAAQALLSMRFGLRVVPMLRARS